MIRIAPDIAIAERDIEERFSRASGPGGQNVNKVSTAAEVRFDTALLPEAVRARLRVAAGRRMTQDGVLVIRAERHRTQKLNRDDALARLIALVRQAAVAPKARRRTAPTATAKRRRLESKRRRGTLKRQRTARSGADD
ncbi:MAG TPA: alternative ribosome rescue aminoacyl-tRNA hydrolase ArfB [Burkholderiales bacterium]|nr:alternative ribosome rescue aminoacyl-tRNA hydrolase ArfB [Burkholderiales bacterium]